VKRLARAVFVLAGLSYLTTLGLDASMARRFRPWDPALEGELVVRSAPGAGTTVPVQIKARGVMPA
jgi:signal transduction histidine kinase